MKVFSKIIQWFIAIIFVIMALGIGSAASTIIILIAAILMAPIKPIRQFLLKYKIKTFFAIVLSIVLLFIGIAISPSIDASNDNDIEDNLVIEDSTTSNNNEIVDESNKETNTELTTEEIDAIIETTNEDEPEKDTTENTGFESTTKNVETTTRRETTTNKKETTTKRETTTVDPDSQVTVYVTATGKKYHYENPCGNGTYYASTLAKAKSRGLTPCDKCVLH